MASSGVVNVSDFCLDLSTSENWILESTSGVSSYASKSMAAGGVILDQAELGCEAEHGVITVEVDGDDRNNALGKDLKLREYQIILDTLRQENGKKKIAAEKLGISPRTLRYKLAQMRENGIDINAELAA